MSDIDLLDKRTPEENRILRERVASIKDNPKVRACLDSYNAAPPRFTIEAIQNGVILDGLPCRLTTGTLALLRAAESRCIGYGKSDAPLTDYDVALAVFLLSDAARNKAASVVDDPDELQRAVKKFQKTLDVQTALVQLREALRRVAVALAGQEVVTEHSEGTESVFRAPDDAWADDVDLLASEYGWSDQYILWEVPVVRVVKLKESMTARKAGKRRTDRKETSSIELLQAIQEAAPEATEHAG